MKKAYILIGKESEIIAISNEFEDGLIEVEYDETLMKDISDGYCYYENGKVVRKESLGKFVSEMLASDMRCMREAECFPIINRGNLWYNNLTEQHKSELSNWYTAWLNVTETLEVPNRPEWLK